MAWAALSLLAAFCALSVDGSASAGNRLSIEQSFYSAGPFSEIASFTAEPHGKRWHIKAVEKVEALPTPAGATRSFVRIVRVGGNKNAAAQAPLSSIELVRGPCCCIYFRQHPVFDRGIER